MDSYRENIFEPLEYYRDRAKHEHNENAIAYFNSLVEKSKINEEENRETAKKYREKLGIVNALTKSLGKLKTIRTVTIVILILATLFSLIPCLCDSVALALKIIIPLSVFVIGLFLTVMIFKKTKTKISALEDSIKKENAQAQAFLQAAENQMAPLNRLFSDVDSFNIIEKTMPQISFDKQFLSENLADLKNNYNFNGVAGDKSSVIDTVSGKLYKNPFLFERFKTEEIVQHTYTGTLTIFWTTYTTDSKGNRVARRHSQTLVAHVVKPKPIYRITTLLNYGSQAAPDLSFSRENEHFENLSEKALERAVKKGKRKLKKKAEKALSTSGGFTEMSNETFDVLFNASNRDNEQQYRVLFTPLAQKEMIDLIRSDVGYGDDFDFFKRKKLNTIRSEHSQNAPLSPTASRYYSYDVDDSRQKFISFNNEYFKSVYFDFAPLISIPAYQDPPATSFEEISHPDISYTAYNYETIANKMGARAFAHERTTTEAILKTELIKRSEDFDTVAVTASSYVAEPRTSFIPKLGGDGRMHPVPVHWKEYIPLQKTSLMSVKNVGISETEFTQRSNEKAHSIPTNATCYKGIFAHTDANKNEIIKFLDNILN